jgi:hypothetical protein
MSAIYPVGHTLHDFLTISWANSTSYEDPYYPFIFSLLLLFRFFVQIWLGCLLLNEDYKEKFLI